MTPSFPLLSRRELLDSFAKISPEKYAKTRNFLTGAVTRLSPYITHGVIRTPELVESVLSRSSPFQADQLLKELIWKEYFTQVLAHRKDEVLRDIEPDKSGISKVSFLPLSVIQGTTGRDWLDRII